MMDELTPEQLEAILGTDYETVLADILRQKADAEGRATDQKEVGQLPSGHVYFDPGGIIQNLNNQYRGTKDARAAQKSLDETLAKQNAGRRTYAEALTRKPPAPPMQAPRSVDSAIPGQAPQAPPMAPGAPPALANASQMPPSRLQGAGVPPDVQALLAKLRGQ
jgi:hypothetical protein